jgi:phage tail sheath protein FI
MSTSSIVDEYHICPSDANEVTALSLAVYDKTTRDEIKAQAESLMLELVGNRAVYDFLVVCDETNNTPARIDRNELYLDIAIEPVKAVEFIYVPLRLKNTGEISGL